MRTGSVCSISAGWPAGGGISRNRFCHCMALCTDLQLLTRKAHTITSPPRCAVSAAKLKAFLLGPAPHELILYPPFCPQRSPSEFSPIGEDALQACLLEAASRQPGSLGQQPREESAWPSWRSLDSPDQTGECFKQHLVGLWVNCAVWRLLAAAWPLSSSPVI